VNIDETGGNNTTLCIERIVAGGCGLDLADLGDDTIFYEDRDSLLILRGVEQSAIGYKKAL
jgi:hypothetical protein